MIIMARFDVESFLQAVERYKPTYTVIATPIVIMMANHPAFPKYDISSLKIVGIGGAALPVNIANRYKARINLFEGYGMSGTATTVSTRRMSIFSSIGLLCPNMDMRVADVTDISGMWALARKENSGSGDSNGIGYWGNEEASAETFLPAAGCAPEISSR